MTAVFETIRVKGGDMPLLGRHLERFEMSRLGAGLDPLPRDVEDAIRTMAALREDDHVLRVDWDGKELEYNSRDLPSMDPVRLITASIPHPGYSVKSTDRDSFDAARDEAEAWEVDGAILLTREGLIAEGTIFAIGWMEGDDVVFPSRDLEILPSIGRARTTECAEKLGLSVKEGRYPRSHLDGKSCFITTSVRGVVPAIELDGSVVPPDWSIARMAAIFWEET